VSTALEAFFAGRVHEGGQALRRTTLRHAHLADSPFGIVVWRLGGERFRAAAVAWGRVGGPFELTVAGEPRNRDLYFAALAPFAADLCEAVRAASEPRVAKPRRTRIDYVPEDALQIVVANRATVGALGLLGRYLAYLSDRSGVAPDPVLVEAGKHLRFYARHSRTPGQALIVPLDRLLAEHWATLLSPLEQANLAALDAQIEPPPGVHAFDSSVAVERVARIGPEPTEDVDRVTTELLEAFNERRRGSVDPAVVRPLLGPLRDHYRRLVEPVWELLARSVARERRLPAAPSVARRFERDRDAYGRHVDWALRGGHYRTTDTPRQAAMTLRRLEEVQSRYEAERAIEDPACMVPFLLDGDAIRGTVSNVNDAHRMLINVRESLRPLLTLDTDDPVVLPAGKRLWWTATAGDQPWEVVEVTRTGQGSRVVLQLTTVPNAVRLPKDGDRITLSTLTTRSLSFGLPLAEEAPWTHRPVTDPPAPEPIDAGDAEPPPPAVDGIDVRDPEAYR
jgi:hypothetical protein